MEPGGGAKETEGILDDTRTTRRSLLLQNTVHFVPKAQRTVLPPLSAPVSDVGIARGGSSEEGPGIATCRIYESACGEFPVVSCEDSRRWSSTCVPQLVVVEAKHTRDVRFE